MKLSLEEIGALKKNYKNNNVLNAFKNVKESDKAVTISDEDKAILDVVANPRRSSKIIMQEKGIVIEKYSYSAGKNLVIVENTKEGLEFNDMIRIPAALENYAEFIGVSQLKTADIEVTLSNDELIVFLALVDIYREKALLINLGKEAEFPMNYAEIREHLEKPLDSSLVTTFRTNFGAEIPKPEATKPILDKLTEKKVVIFDKKFTLADEYATMAVNFLIPNIVINGETFQNNDTDEPIGISFLYISAGIKNNLLFMFGAGETEVSTVSSAYVLDLMDGFFRCPKLD